MEKSSSDLQGKSSSELEGKSVDSDDATFPCSQETVVGVGLRMCDPPVMWQMCGSLADETVTGHSVIELGNLLAGLHPRIHHKT